MKIGRSTVTSAQLALLVVTVLVVMLVASGAGSVYLFQQNRRLTNSVQQIQNENSILEAGQQATQTELQTTKQSLEALQKTDQVVRNDELEKRLGELQKTYASAVLLYEKVLGLQEQKVDTQPLVKTIAATFSQLAKNELEEANKSLAELTKVVTEQEQKLIVAPAPAAAPPVASKVSNEAPTAGYSRQAVDVDGAKYTVSLIAADMNSTRVIVDTVSSSDCANDCPVLSLQEYVSRNSGYAGINGSYFCPASYPSCAGKTNSFDLLVMNKDKTYFNSANNVYSSNPAVIFSSGSMRFVGAASEWGRDTGVDGVLSNYPLLVSGGQSRFGGGADVKMNSKGNRSFVANKGSTAYIGVVHGASVAEAARVLQALGMDNALNLDSGGSTALWSNGYVVGPGRNIPNAIIFVRK